MNPNDKSYWIGGMNEFGGWIEIFGQHCVITIEPRPSYCDRGNYIAKIFAKPGIGPDKFYLDEADMWPRYYFDIDRAKLEVEAWLKKRKEWIE